MPAITSSSSSMAEAASKFNPIHLKPLNSQTPRPLAFSIPNPQNPKFISTSCHRPHCSPSPKSLKPHISPVDFRNPNKYISFFHPRQRSPPLTKPSCSSLPDPVASPLFPNSRSLKSRLAVGETLYGLFLLSASPTLAEIAGLAGYDYVVIDMEHGPGSISDALSCLRALAATGAAAVLRLPETSAAWAKKALDLGPQGIMFPMIEDARAAELAVSFCRFPPHGVRGSAHTVVRASAYGINDGYLAQCEEELLVMCQIESIGAVADIEEIAAVEGVDCLQMGPLDLSASMGYLWNPGHRKVRVVMRDVERRALAAGRYLSGFAMPHDRPEDMKVRGYHMVAGAVDVGMFRKAAVEDVVRFRRAETGIGEGGGGDEKADDESYWSKGCLVRAFTQLVNMHALEDHVLVKEDHVLVKGKKKFS